jgi:hypothetical protein
MEWLNDQVRQFVMLQDAKARAREAEKQQRRQQAQQQHPSPLPNPCCKSADVPDTAWRVEDRRADWGRDGQMAFGNDGKPQRRP